MNDSARKKSPDGTDDDLVTTRRGEVLLLAKESFGTLDSRFKLIQGF